MASCLFVCLSICCHNFLTGGWLSNLHFPISASVRMAWNPSFPILLAFLYLMDFATAKNLCKTEVSVPGMALKGYIFKKFPVAAPHVCVITCERERICQSFNYVLGENSCELNTRTMEARPENFQPDGSRFYMRHFKGRSMFILHTNLSQWVLRKNPPLSKSKCLLLFY